MKNQRRKGNENMLLDLLDEVKALAEELRQCEISEKEIAEWEKSHLEDVQDSDTELGVMSPGLQKIVVSAESQYELLKQIENPSEEVKKEKLVLRALFHIFWDLVKNEIPAAHDREEDLIIREGFVVVVAKRRCPLVGRVVIMR